MKKTFVLLCLVVLVVATSFGQTISMTPQYTAYDSLELTSDGNLHETVAISGSTVGQCCQTVVCGPNNQQCTFCNSQCQTAQHQPQAVAKINGVGSQVNGPMVSPFSYLSWSNVLSTTTPLKQDGTQQLEMSTAATVYCTGLAAAIFSTFFDHFFLWAHTKSHMTSTISSGTIGYVCGLEDWCTSDTTPPLAHFGSVFDTDRTCRPYYWLSALCSRASRTQTWQCGTGIKGVLNIGLGTTDSTRGACTPLSANYQ